MSKQGWSETKAKLVIESKKNLCLYFLFHRTLPC